MKNREQRRELRERKIKKRKNLLQSLYPWYSKNGKCKKINLPKDGYLENGSFLNGAGGLSEKTNWKKRHSNYRRKCGYGKGMNYKPHDQRQIDQALDQEEIE